MFASHKSIELKIESASGLSMVRVDVERIKQVVNNLIRSAVKYSLPGTTVTINTQTHSHEVHVSVIDQGQGIPKGKMDMLFKDFSRTSVRPTGNECSTGLGLAIAQRIVEAHGGKIRAESTVGVGSTFTFTLLAAVE